MKTHIALLRGIGGKYTLPMKALVQLLENMSLHNVSTYIQTGNAIFQSAHADDKSLPDRIRAAIHDGYGFAPQVILLTPKQLSAAIAANPYPAATADPTTLHLFFLAAAPESPDFATLDRIRTDSEHYALKGKVLYLHTPDGVGRSKLAARIEKSLGVIATARNWRTVCKLKALAALVHDGNNREG